MYRRMMRISWTEHRTDNSILEELESWNRHVASWQRSRGENYSTSAIWFALIISARTVRSSWHRCRKNTPRKTTETLDWRHQAIDWNTRCRVCWARKGQKRAESLGVRVSDLRSSVMRMDLGRQAGFLYILLLFFSRAVDYKLKILCFSAHVKLYRILSIGWLIDWLGRANNNSIRFKLTLYKKMKNADINFYDAEYVERSNITPSTLTRQHTTTARLHELGGHVGHVTTPTSSSTSGRPVRRRTTSGSVVQLITLRPHVAIDDCMLRL